jgi:hypothetical protein
MTRRPKKKAVARKPARKTVKAAKRAKPLAHPLDPFIAAGARALDLKIDKTWLPAVRGHLEVTLRLGALVASFALPDETDPAPVFEA